MKTKNGLTVGPERTFSDAGPSNHTWCLASRHYPDSITWSWAIFWTKRGSGSLWKYIFQWAYSPNRYGFLILPLGLHIAWQETMWRDAAALRASNGGGEGEKK